MSRHITILTFLLLAHAALAQHAPPASPARPAVTPPPPLPEPRYTAIGDLPGLPAVTRLSWRLWHGGPPAGERGMIELRRLGVEHILAVDAPDQSEVDAAKDAGIAVVTIATDGVSLSDEVIRLILDAYRIQDGPTYVHGRRGDHRAAAATALLRRTFEGITKTESLRELEDLGCPAGDQLLHDLVRRSRPDPARAHRLPAPIEGLDGLVEVTPMIFRAATELDERALAGLHRLGIEAIVSADITDLAAERARDAGFEVIILPIRDQGPTAEQASTVARNLATRWKSRVLLHSMSDAARPAAMAAACRIANSKWSPEDAAIEVESTVGTPAAAVMAKAVRDLPAPTEPIVQLFALAPPNNGRAQRSN